MPHCVYPRFLPVLYVLCLLVFIGSGLTPIKADQGIVLSNSCLTMLKNNITTNCPTYEQILTVFPDTSNRRMSGDFNNIEGILQRAEPQYENHYDQYRYDALNLMWIDPPGDVLDKISLITIAPDDFTYKIKGQVMTNNTLLVGDSRYINSKCHDATISAKLWLFLLGDTIQLMNHNCDRNHTNFEEVKKRIYGKTEHDITTSYKYKLDKWIAESKIRCKQKCFEY